MFFSSSPQRYRDADRSWSEEDSTENQCPPSSKSSPKGPLEIEIIDPLNEKKFEELAARDEKLKTYKRRYSGNVEMAAKGGTASADDDDDEDSDGEDQKEPKCKRSTWKNMERDRVVSESSSSSTVEFETDPETLGRRQKQVDFGKNTLGYDNYSRLVPKNERKPGNPRTPPKNVKYSRRAWDGLIKVWRKKLHEWDDQETADD